MGTLGSPRVGTPPHSGNDQGSTYATSYITPTFFEKRYRDMSSEETLKEIGTGTLDHHGLSRCRCDGIQHRSSPFLPGQPGIPSPTYRRIARYGAALQAGAPRGLLGDRCRAANRGLFQPVCGAYTAAAPVQCAVRHPVRPSPCHGDETGSTPVQRAIGA